MKSYKILEYIYSETSDSTELENEINCLAREGYKMKREKLIPSFAGCDGIVYHPAFIVAMEKNSNFLSKLFSKAYEWGRGILIRERRCDECGEIIDNDKWSKLHEESSDGTKVSKFYCHRHPEITEQIIEDFRKSIK